MKLIAQGKLLPTPEQATALKSTVELANAACEFVSQRAWQTKTFKQYDLHHLGYQDVRAKFDWSAQVTVRVIAKVADAYTLDKKAKRAVKPLGGIGYDDRILAWRMSDATVSIGTGDGRLRIPCVWGAHQRGLLDTRHGESDWVLFRDKFFLSATGEVEAPKPVDVDGALGVDLGVTHIAVDSAGEIHSARHSNNVRHRHRRLRPKLQALGTKSAQRKLKRLSGMERRLAKDTNHRIRKQRVVQAQGTQRAMAVEDLTGIRTRVTARRSQRAALHSWAFFQLRQFVQYKAQGAGVPVVLVDPRNTSRTCPDCGHVDTANRKSQSQFSCVVCGFSGLADYIAACNIASRAVVNPPIVASGLSAL